jgi:hypothetical protein
MGEKSVLKCHQCGSYLILIAEGNARQMVACLGCGALYDAKEVTENSAGLIGGTLTPKEVLDLSEQVRAASKK